MSSNVPFAPALPAARTYSKHKSAQARPGGAPRGRRPPSPAVASLNHSKDLPLHTPQNAEPHFQPCVKAFFFLSEISSVLINLSI